ncbi:hypothetical protein DWU98_15885 [Dyella monticola]|uniref:Uncharacterized protein n=1 Tax=Dyella monticola TaxID=1927958 RepID=A0A370WUV0_9GAMM|nr:hypothetical protein [Dyella monticola]RDS79918.1 hypothetical protein DWU98_15885 [Dyella monticola]
MANGAGKRTGKRTGAAVPLFVPRGQATTSAAPAQGIKTPAPSTDSSFIKKQQPAQKKAKVDPQAVSAPGLSHAQAPQLHSPPLPVPPPQAPQLPLPASGLTALTKPSLTFSHESFQPRKIDSGSTLQYHAFSNISPKTTSEVVQYIKSTGLEPIETIQDWGTGAATRMYRSRRGSVAGLSEMKGAISGWRLHSLPTSEALAVTPAGKGDKKAFIEKYEESGGRLIQPAVNTRGTPQSVNTVLSDFMKVRYDSTKGEFEATGATHAMGVSGAGLDKTHSSASQALYGPSIEVAKARGKSGSPAQAFHSEPMAMTFHNLDRSTKLEHDTGTVGIFASIPNQVCFHCGDMFGEKIGEHSVVSGAPGVPFGGQHEGAVHDRKKDTTVIRATPFITLQGNKANQDQVGSIYDHHKR